MTHFQAGADRGPLHLEEDSIEFQDNVQVINFDRAADTVSVQNQVLAKFPKLLSDYFMRHRIEPSDQKEEIRQAIKNSLSNRPATMASEKPSAYFVDRKLTFLNNVIRQNINEQMMIQSLANQPCYSYQQADDRRKSFASQGQTLAIE